MVSGDGSVSFRILMSYMKSSSKVMDRMTQKFFFFFLIWGVLVKFEMNKVCIYPSEDLVHQFPVYVSKKNNFSSARFACIDYPWAYIVGNLRYPPSKDLDFQYMKQTKKLQLSYCKVCMHQPTLVLHCWCTSVIEFSS